MVTNLEVSARMLPRFDVPPALLLDVGGAGLLGIRRSDGAL